jgi:hypothetical protein
MITLNSLLIAKILVSDSSGPTASVGVPVGPVKSYRSGRLHRTSDIKANDVPYGW